MQTPHESGGRGRVFVLAARLKTALGGGCGRLRQYLSRLVREWSSCWECGEPVEIVRDAREEGGAGEPIWIDISASVLRTAVYCQVALLLI